jgi:gamma-glutamyltranspeptidase/glutathione hydrolase
MNFDLTEEQTEFRRTVREFAEEVIAPRAEEMDRLEELGYAVTRWRRRNLFFGGVAGVELRADGMLAAAGDPRRGGHGIVVG